MGQTLTNGIYLPNEGERNCYSGLAANWNAVDTLKGNYSLHAINVDIHVTAAEKETWNSKADNSALTAHTGDTTIHVTSADKQAWDGHVADAVKHVTAEDKNKWNAVTSKADDSDVVHKSGNETVGGKKTFTDDITASKNASNMAIYLQNLTYDPKTNGQSGVEGKSCGINFLTSTGDPYINIAAYGLSERTLLRLTCSYFTDSQNVDYDSVEFSIYGNGSRSFRPRNTSNCDLGESNKKWKGVYAINYYYGSNNVEFSDKFVTTDTNQTISGNKTFSSINGVEPSSLSLPSGNVSDFIDISSYFSNTGTGNTNSYTASANGWIYLRLGNISGCVATILDANNNIMWGQSATGSVELLTIPILKGQTLSTQWNTSSTVYVAIARFIPCQGNV